MLTRTILFFLVFGICIGLKAQNITVYRSHLSVDETTTKLENLIKEKDLIFFETVHHHEIAEERGLEVGATNVIFFEDPVLTTELLGCEQTSALDLPLKLMVWEEEGDVYMGYIDPQLMRRRFLIKGCDEVLGKMTGLCVRIINEALRQG